MTRNRIVLEVADAALVEDGVAFEIGASEKMRLRRGRRELVALDRKAEQRDTG
jgi:hypothetical protein